MKAPYNKIMKVELDKKRMILKSLIDNIWLLLACSFMTYSLILINMKLNELNLVLISLVFIEWILLIFNIIGSYKKYMYQALLAKFLVDSLQKKMQNKN